jgi:hypothetical protein
VPAAVAYGAGLGAGFATHVASAAYWVGVAVAGATADPALGAALGALMGASRAVAIVSVTRSLRDWEGARARVSAIVRTERVMHLAAAGLLVALAVVTPR